MLKEKKNCIFTELDHQYYSDRNDTKQTILIVDDSELNRAILYEILKDDFLFIGSYKWARMYRLY